MLRYLLQSTFSYQDPLDVDTLDQLLTLLDENRFTDATELYQMTTGESPVNARRAIKRLLMKQIALKFC